MKRTYICFCLLAVSLVSALGQEQAPSMRARLRGLRGNSARRGAGYNRRPGLVHRRGLTPDTG